MEYLRALRQAPDDGDNGSPGDPIRFIASTSGIKRDKFDLNQDLWHLDNYRRNNVFLWVHDYMGQNLPLGNVEAKVEDGDLVADVLFDQEDDFARKVESKYRRGFLHAVSVGWEEVVIEGQRRFDLLDISAVPVPGDPDALMERQKVALRGLGQSLLDMDELAETPSLEPETIVTPIKTEVVLPEVEIGIDHEQLVRDIVSAILPPLQEQINIPAVADTSQREAIPPHTTDLAPEDMTWDGPAEVAKAEAEEDALRRMFTWVDSDADPDTKRAYKLPHHLAETGEAVWRGVAAAMSRLMQVDTQIPERDRRGVFDHLANHYEQFGKTPPEFRTVEQLRGLDTTQLFVEAEPSIFPELFAVTGIRAGAILSKRIREELEKALQGLRDGVDLVQSVVDRATPAEDLGIEDRAFNRGRSLAAFLDRQIERLMDDDTSRGEIVIEMARAANITEREVYYILNAEVTCPPLRRLEGFSEVLDVSVDSLVRAARQDGCEYERTRSDSCLDEDPQQRGQRGRKLAAYLNGQIDKKVTDELSQSDIVAQMARAAGISAGTVNQILNGEINCPPLRRLIGFAEVLDVSENAVVRAAEGDGCEYERQQPEPENSILTEIREYLADGE